MSEIKRERERERERERGIESLNKERYKHKYAPRDIEKKKD